LASPLGDRSRKLRSVAIGNTLPRDASERALFLAEGKRPYSLRVGGYWFNYGRLSPLGLYLAQAVDLHDAVEKGDETVSSKALRLMSSSLRGLKDQTFLQGMSSIFDFINDPERNGAKLVQQTVTGLLPSFLRDIRQQADRVVREPKGIGQAIANAVPSVSQNVPPRVDLLGQIATLPANRLVRATKMFSEPVTGDPAAAARELRETEAEIPIPKAELRQGKGRVILDGQERAEFLRQMGLATLSTVLAVSRRPGFKDSDPEEQARAIEKAVEESRDSVRRAWRKTYAIQLSDAARAAK
jgi:hypothetical protein